MTLYRIPNHVNEEFRLEVTNDHIFLQYTSEKKGVIMINSNIVFGAGQKYQYDFSKPNDQSWTRKDKTMVEMITENEYWEYQCYKFPNNIFGFEIISITKPNEDNNSFKDPCWWDVMFVHRNRHIVTLQKDLTIHFQ